MKPDQQSNYWQHDSQEPPVAPEPEMYTPEPFELGQAPTAPLTPEPTEQPLTVPEVEPIHWSATEYIHHEKNGLWFVLFALVVLALIVLSIFVIKSYTFTALIVVMAIAVVVFARRPPHPIDYTLSGDQGLYVGERLYPYRDFKSFALIQDGEHHSVLLIPTKRFSPGVSVYFPEEAGEQIVDLLGARLPMETRKMDLIDILVRKLRL